MPTLIVPFRGENAKQRLAPLPERSRRRLAFAMLADVVAACREVGRTLVVTPQPLGLTGVELVTDTGRGQGAAVVNALALVRETPVAIVNADLPCATPRDLLTLCGAVPPDGLALVEADDGTTNALALSSPALFEPVFGPGSAERFRSLAEATSVTIPNLAADVDTLEELARLEQRVGPRTAAALEGLRAAAR